MRPNTPTAEIITTPKEQDIKVKMSEKRISTIEEITSHNSS